MTLNNLMVEVSVMLELWGMRNTPSLQLLSDPLWPEMVAPDRALSMCQIELTAYLCQTELFQLELFD